MLWIERWAMEGLAWRGFCWELSGKVQEVNKLIEGLDIPVVGKGDEHVRGLHIKFWGVEIVEQSVRNLEFKFTTRLLIFSVIPITCLVPLVLKI